MSYEILDACNGCAECISCGRKGREYIVYYCDYCDESLSPDMLRRDKCGKDICLDCFLDRASESWNALDSVEELDG